MCLKIDQRAKDILKEAIASSAEDVEMIPKQAITMQHLPLRHHFWYRCILLQSENSYTLFYPRKIGFYLLENKVFFHENVMKITTAANSFFLPF